jgi:hypothetical protein
MEFAEPQVRPCKKLFMSGISKGNPEASADLVPKREHFSMLSSGIFHVNGYNSSLSSPTSARGFVAIREESAIWALGENVQAARFNNS